MKDALPFYINNKVVGYLKTDKENNLHFSYDETWKGGEISPVLPMDQPCDSVAVKNWFRELLPDERRRKSFEVMTKLSLNKIQEFLFWYGEDLPGNLSISPGSNEEAPKDITKFVSHMIKLGESLDSAAFKLSLAGGEPKTAIIIDGKEEETRFFAPSASFPSSHILKSSRNFACVEDYTTQLAKRTGLFQVSNLRPIAIEKIPFLLIERFDRQIIDGKRTRIMQEDFCQATGKLARYGKDENGIEIEEMVKIMQGRLEISDIEKFIKMTFFAMCVGNSDDHAGNYAMLKINDKWELAPAYDLVSVATLQKMATTSQYPLNPMLAYIDLEQARRFGQHRDAYDIDHNDFLEMAVLFQIDKNKLLDIFKNCASVVHNELNSSFEAEMRNRWSNLDLNEGNINFARAALPAFMETVGERTSHILSLVDKVAEKLEELENDEEDDDRHPAGP